MSSNWRNPEISSLAVLIQEPYMSIFSLLVHMGIITCMAVLHKATHANISLPQKTGLL